MEEAEGETRVYEEAAGGGRGNPYPVLVDRVDEGEIAECQSGWGWASEQTVQFVGSHSVFPSTGFHEGR